MYLYLYFYRIKQNKIKTTSKEILEEDDVPNKQDCVRGESSSEESLHAHMDIQLQQRQQFKFGQQQQQQQEMSSNDEMYLHVTSNSAPCIQHRHEDPFTAELMKEYDIHDERASFEYIPTTDEDVSDGTPSLPTRQKTQTKPTTSTKNKSTVGRKKKKSKKDKSEKSLAPLVGKLPPLRGGGLGGKVIPPIIGNNNMSTESLAMSKIDDLSVGKHLEMPAKKASPGLLKTSSQGLIVTKQQQEQHYIGDETLYEDYNYPLHEYEEKDRHMSLEGLNGMDARQELLN